MINLQSLLLGTGRKKALFSLELWNVHDRVSTNFPRSNNSIEGWHSAFGKTRNQNRRKRIAFLTRNFKRPVDDYRNVDLK